MQPAAHHQCQSVAARDWRQIALGTLSAWNPKEPLGSSRPAGRMSGFVDHGPFALAPRISGMPCSPLPCAMADHSLGGRLHRAGTRARAARRAMPKRLALVLPLVGLLTSCGSFGPATVAHDRLAYAQVTADSAKQQTLLNVVRLRYGDHVSFFRVAQVVSGYTLMGEGRIGADIFMPNWLASLLVVEIRDGRRRAAATATRCYGAGGRCRHHGRRNNRRSAHAAAQRPEPLARRSGPGPHADRGDRDQPVELARCRDRAGP